jgi:hypothetical protein
LISHTGEEQKLRVFKKEVFGPKMEEITGQWRNLHNEELHDVYSSQNKILMIKSRRIRLAGHVACMRKR